MRILQLITLKLLSAAVLALGITLLFVPSHQIYQAMSSYVVSGPAHVFRLIFGVIVFAIGVWGLIPLPKARRRAAKAISFPDSQGNTTIMLSAIEDSLSRIVTARPDVKRARILVEPADENRRVRLDARLVLRKGPGTSARDVVGQIKDYIADQGRQILGPGEIVGVDLTVEDVVMDKKAAKSSSPIEEAPAMLREEPESRPFSAPAGGNPAEPGDERDEGYVALLADEQPEEPIPSGEPELAYLPELAAPIPDASEEEDPLTPEPGGPAPLPGRELPSPAPSSFEEGEDSDDEDAPSILSLDEDEDEDEEDA